MGLSFDLDRYLPVDDEQDFLRTQMHMPGCGRAGRHVQHIGNRLLDLAILAVEIAAQDLRDFRPALCRLGQYRFRSPPTSGGRGCKLQQAATSQNHGSVLPHRLGRCLFSLRRANHVPFINTGGGARFPGRTPARARSIPVMTVYRMMGPASGSSSST